MEDQNSESLKDFLGHLVKYIVDKPDDIEIAEREGQDVIVFEVRVGDGDLGKVIGKNGQNANSIRTLLSAVAAKRGHRAFLEILE
jgi:predicted RNA-binding protein YlqC (UPF0109 family)